MRAMPCAQALNKERAMRIFTPMTIAFSVWILFTTLLCAEVSPVYSATPLPTKYYSPSARMPYPHMTFVIPAANKLRQAIRTVTLANKRQKAGIDTVILFEDTAVTLPAVRGIPFGVITEFRGENVCAPLHTMPKCPRRVTDDIPPIIPEIMIPDAKQIYLPLLNELLLEHAQLGGKIVLCPCCERNLPKGIQFLPKEIAPEKLRRLEKQLKTTEGNY